MPVLLSEKKSILCVEDDTDTCDLLEFLFSDYNLVFAQTVEKSLELFQPGRFDLCLLDNWLIDGDGTDLCRQIRLLDTTVPIVFASGVAHQHEIQKALAAGAQAYLVKPYQTEELQQIVKELIGRK